MFNQQYIVMLLFVTFLTACNNNSTNSTSSGQSNETKTPTITTKEVIHNDFNDFIDKFSTDSAFQIGCTKFPLKIKWYDLDDDKDSLIYKDKSSFEMVDFRKKKSTSRYDQWEQKIVIDKSNTSATIEIRGIENGIMIDYLFEKINGAWMLIEIDDSST